jgi:hypothetical protein
MISAEDIQRQVTVVPVVAVKETRLLLPVQRRVGRIQVQHDLCGRFGVRFQKQVHEQLIQRFG